jgi:drug/metabolite transporter (DMT)-like permease
VKTLVTILVPIFLGVIGQFFLKYGMNQIGEFSILSGNVLLKYFKILFNPFVFIGLALYFVSALLWLYVLSRIDLSFAYPMLSLSYVIVIFGSWMLFGEKISMTHGVGVAIIIFGVYLIGKG